MGPFLADSLSTRSGLLWIGVALAVAAGSRTTPHRCEHAAQVIWSTHHLAPVAVFLWPDSRTADHDMIRVAAGAAIAGYPAVRLSGSLERDDVIVKLVLDPVDITTQTDSHLDGNPLTIVVSCRVGLRAAGIMDDVFAITVGGARVTAARTATANELDLSRLACISGAVEDAIAQAIPAIAAH